jgi:NADPH-dependent curcumin reductase CurA
MPADELKRGEMERIVLVRHIDGVPTPDDFRVEMLPIPQLAEGQFLVRNHFVSCDPGTRSRLSPGASYAPPLQPGAPVDGFCVGEVIESRNERFSVGEIVALSGWASHVVSNGRGFCVKIPDLGVPESLWIGLLGVPGMTAWFGLRRVAALKAGDRVLVTSAAGPVGATAGQLAKLWGASEVVGIAGGAEKCAWLTDVAGFDRAIDYKSADFDAVFAEVSAGGWDILFDNVGNAMIDRALPVMKMRGRIVVSGQVADYNTPVEQVPGLKQTREFIAKRLRMEGLVVFDDLAGFAAAQSELADLIKAGTVKYREEVFEGLASLPAAFCGLFSGSSFGRRVVRVG